jgi:DNA-binding NtrC family response regulator
VVAVGQGVGVTKSFIAKSPSAIEALKSATLLKGLQINALIFGASGSGKKTLATTILSDAPIVSADNFNELLDIVKETKAVIITNFERVPNTQELKKALEKYQTRLIATTSVELPGTLYNEFFSIKIELPDLSERPEDVKVLSKKFLEEFSDVSGPMPEDFCDTMDVDLSDNAHSLKRSVMINALYKNISESELIQIIESYFQRNLPKENAYRDSLHLFDIPIIKEGLRQYKSQLKLSEVLGINRNTLRKKIQQYNQELDNE